MPSGKTATIAQRVTELHAERQADSASASREQAPSSRLPSKTSRSDVKLEETLLPTQVVQNETNPCSRVKDKVINALDFLLGRIGQNDKAIARSKETVDLYEKMLQRVNQHFEKQTTDVSAVDTELTNKIADIKKSLTQPTGNLYRGARSPRRSSSKRRRSSSKKTRPKSRPRRRAKARGRGIR